MLLAREALRTSPRGKPVAPPRITCEAASPVKRAGEKRTMSAEPNMTADVIGLTKAAPFSRRGFMTASAAMTAGYTLAAGPVRADVIKTDTNGLATGDAKIKVADGEMPGYFARPTGI